MHVDDQKIRRVISILGTAAVAGALVTTVTSASASSSRAIATTTAFALKGSIAGGIKTVQTDQTLTFVFTEANQSTVGYNEFLVITKASNTSVNGISPCVLPGGFAINSDGLGVGTSCEPFVKAGQSASIVITTTVTGASGTYASVQVCLTNGVPGPCKTLSAKVG